MIIVCHYSICGVTAVVPRHTQRYWNGAYYYQYVAPERHHEPIKSLIDSPAPPSAVPREVMNEYAETAHYIWDNPSRREREDVCSVRRSEEAYYTGSRSADLSSLEVLICMKRQEQAEGFAVQYRRETGNVRNSERSEKF